MNKYKTNDKIEKRFFAKIRLSKDYKALAKTVYLRKDLTFELFRKYKWFFLYREALLRIKYPRYFIELTLGNYDYELPEVIYKKKLRNKLISKKRNVTKFSNQIAIARASWNELFPIESHPKWSKVLEKLKRYQKELIEAQNEYDLQD